MRRFAKISFVCSAAALLLVSCGKPGKEGGSKAGDTTTTSSSTVSTQPSVSPSEDLLLRSGIQGLVYLSVGLQRDGRYCEGPADVPASIQIRALANQRTPFFDRLPVQIGQHDAVMRVVKPTFSSQDNGLISGGTCYTVDPTFARSYQVQGITPSLDILLGPIVVTQVQLVNEYQMNTGSGPSKARSYHVQYFVQNTATGSPALDGVTQRHFVATCVLVHDNVENNWTYNSCPSNG